MITAFNLDADYYVGENLYFIVSEAMAALSMAIGRATRELIEVMQECENPEDHEEAEGVLQSLFGFAVQTFLGKQMVASPGKTLRDFLPVTGM